MTETARVERRRAAAAAAALPAFLACACAQVAAPGRPAGAETPRTELREEYRKLAGPGDALLAISPSGSRIRVYAFRGGRAARLGHNHVITIDRAEGFILLPAGKPANAKFELVFRLDEMRFDEPAERERLGGAFASTLSAEDSARTRENLLGADGVRAQEFPQVRIQSVRVVGEMPWTAALVRFEMHGERHETWVALELQGDTRHLRAKGAFVVRQSDFGIAPYTVFGGLLSVEDPLVVEFSIDADALDSK